MTLPNGKKIEYVLDGQNRRVAKKVNGKIVQGYIYQSQLQVAALTDGAGKIVSQFVYTSKSNSPDYIISEGETYKVMSDQVGTPIKIVNSSNGKVAHEFNFDEFGIEEHGFSHHHSKHSQKSIMPFGFAGGLYDKDTGLVHFGAREYDPEIGRWTSKDPIGFAGGDSGLYAYCGSDPINCIDPTGLRIVDITGGLIPLEVKSSKLYRDLDKKKDLIIIKINNTLGVGVAGITSYNSSTGTQTIEINFRDHTSRNDYIDTFIHELNHASLNITFRGETEEIFDTDLILPSEIKKNFGEGGINAGQCL